MTLMLKNHSQLEELRTDTTVLFNKRVGRIDGNPQGYETPLGHTYALILEELADAGLGHTPDLSGFLRFIEMHLSVEYQGTTTPMTPTFSPSIWVPVKEFMRMQDVPVPGYERIHFELFGEYPGIRTRTEFRRLSSYSEEY